ncbi:MAG: NAD(P)H-binding protein [Gemmatimonadaceae bacterium]
MLISTRKTLAIFGATGRTGRRVLEESIQRGYVCRVLVRDRARLATSDDSLSILEGDARDAGDVGRTLAGTDAVLCCLGLTDISLPTTEFSDIVQVIIAEMKEKGVARIMAIAAAGALDHRDGGYRSKTGPPEFAHIAAEHVRNYESLRDSGLDWTLMCPVTLTSDIPAGHPRLAFDDLPEGSSQTGYDDLAQTMVDLLDEPNSIGRRVGIISLA